MAVGAGGLLGAASGASSRLQRAPCCRRGADPSVVPPTLVQNQHSAAGYPSRFPSVRSLQVSEEDFTLEQLDALSKEEASGRRAKRQRT